MRARSVIELHSFVKNCIKESCLTEDDIFELEEKYGYNKGIIDDVLEKDRYTLDDVIQCVLGSMGMKMKKETVYVIESKKND